MLCIGKYGEMLIDHLDKVECEEVFIVNVFSFSLHFMLDYMFCIGSQEKIG